MEEGPELWVGAVRVNGGPLLAALLRTEVDDHVDEVEHLLLHDGVVHAADVLHAGQDPRGEAGGREGTGHRAPAEGRLLRGAVGVEDPYATHGHVIRTTHACLGRA